MCASSPRHVNDGLDLYGDGHRQKVDLGRGPRRIRVALARKVVGVDAVVNLEV